MLVEIKVRDRIAVVISEIIDHSGRHFFSPFSVVTYFSRDLAGVRPHSGVWSANNPVTLIILSSYIFVLA